MANEKRLIDANVPIEKLEEHRKLFIDAWQGFAYLSNSDKARVDEIDTCIAEIINAPTVDAVEVVHGRWEDVSLRFTQVKEKCSVCGGIVYAHGFNYCPNCGAKMDGDGNA